jgi:AraC family transcriptional activator of pobA
MFYISSGAGKVSLDTETLDLQSPFLLLIPAGVVHGFAWSAETQGSVLTVADSYLREVAARAPALAELFERPLVLPTVGEDVMSTGLGNAFARLAHEAVWDAPGHDAAVEAHLLVILVAALRLGRQTEDEQALKLGPQAGLVTRFRDAVERGFRSAASVADFAAGLGVTEKQLRTACLKVAGMSPLQLLHRRKTLEAKRLLTYSSMTIAEVGYSLGFEDPAYFSRFFGDQTGASPRAFRAQGRRVAPR